MKIKKILIFLIIIFSTNFSVALENKILVKVNNEIISTVDILKEIKFLNSLNPSFRKIDNIEAFEIAKKSLIKQKIKEIYLIKIFNKLILKEDYKDILLTKYSMMNINNLIDLETYLKNFGISIQDLEKKIIIDIFWSQMIVNRYSNAIKIDRDKIKRDLLDSNNFIEYNLSEILFETNLDEIDEKNQIIRNSIKEDNFEKTALIYSLSDTSSNGGLIGWVKENSINKNILLRLEAIDIGEITDSITVPGGILILKINDKREVKKFEDLELEINNTIKLSTNNQLNRLSNILLNKIEKNITINEL